MAAWRLGGLAGLPKLKVEQRRKQKPKLKHGHKRYLASNYTYGEYLAESEICPNTNYRSDNLKLGSGQTRTTYPDPDRRRLFGQGRGEGSGTTVPGSGTI